MTTNILHPLSQRVDTDIIFSGSLFTHTHINKYTYIHTIDIHTQPFAHKSNRRKFVAFLSSQSNDLWIALKLIVARVT
jgi:hypothetical protein